MKKPSKPRPSSSSNASAEAAARLFFALWPPAGVIPALADAAVRGAERYGGKPTRPETLHLTLLFLGHFPVDRIPQLIAAARTVDFPAFALCIDRLGAWSHNRLLWAGCSTVPPALVQLVAALSRVLNETALFAQEDTRDFVPHLTLVRKLAQVPEFAARTADWQPIDWPVTTFALLRSRRDANGACYETLAHFAARPATR